MKTTIKIISVIIWMVALGILALAQDNFYIYFVGVFGILLGWTIKE